MPLGTAASLPGQPETTRAVLHLENGPFLIRRAMKFAPTGYWTVTVVEAPTGVPSLFVVSARPDPSVNCMVASHGPLHVSGGIV